MAGIASFVFIFGIAKISSPIFLTALIAGIFVFLVVLFLNPRHRFLRMFSSLLGFWAAVMVVPAFHLELRPDHPFAEFLSNHVSPVFHLCMTVLCAITLWLDWLERRQPDKRSVPESNHTMGHVNAQHSVVVSGDIVNSPINIGFTGEQVSNIPQAVTNDRFEKALPTADSNRYSIAIAHFENDDKQQHERRIVDTLRDFKGVQPLQFDRTISLAPGNPEEAEQAGHTTAREYLNESGAQVLIWGTVFTLNGNSAPRTGLHPNGV